MHTNNNNNKYKYFFCTRRDKSEVLGGNVYLIGTTNVGKSSLFNFLMDSDLCDAKALCKIDKATIAPVPGTTLNLLKFPIMKPEPHADAVIVCHIR